MKQVLTYLFGLMFVLFYRGQNRAVVQPGAKAPSFVLNRGENTIQGFTMPYMNKIVVLHFWNYSALKSKTDLKALRYILDKYRDSDFINAEGLEVLSVAVTDDQNQWHASIELDSISDFINGIALKGFDEEDVCLKFGVQSVPTTLVVDETAEIVFVNPKMGDLENYLDSKKNVHAQKKDIYGIFALSSSVSDKVRYSKVYLFNRYGDSLAYTRTNENGVFTFHDISLSQDLTLKLDNQLDILTSDPTGLYNTKGELLMKGSTLAGGFVFSLPSKMILKLQLADSNLNTVPPLEVTVTKYLRFNSANSALTSADIKELNGILSTLEKNKKSTLEIAVHTDQLLNATESKALSDQRGQLLKSYFLNKGVAENRLRLVSYGNSQPAIPCAPSCSEEEHKKNRRIEFTILKN